MAREAGTQTVQEEVCTETSHSKSGTVLRTSTPDMLYCAVFTLVYSLNGFPSLLPRNCHLKCELSLFFTKTGQNYCHQVAWNVCILQI